MSKKPASIASAAKFSLRGRFRSPAKILRIPPPDLSELELLEIVLLRALPNRDLKRIIAELLDRFGSLAGVLSAPQRELARCDGLNEHAICLILVVHESMLRATYAVVAERAVVSTSSQLLDYLQTLFGHQQIERAHVLYLNTRNEIIVSECQGIGSVTESPIITREVLKRALELNATAIILAHNHPSGDPTPSDHDVQITNEIRTAGQALSIKLHDHVIVASGSSFSFYRHGLL